MFTDMNPNSLSYSSPWMNANIDVHFDDIRNHECLIVYGDKVIIDGYRYGSDLLHSIYFSIRKYI